MTLREIVAKGIGYIYRLVEVREPIDHHQVNNRPWGSYTVIERTENYRIKKLKINPKARLSLQKHKLRSEHWVVVDGTAEVQVGEGSECNWLIETGASVFVSAGTKHRISNPNDTVLKIIEVQIGKLDEGDIIRFEDMYGRLCKLWGAPPHSKSLSQLS
jgi:mannose-6-phosphate isomerase-like protein (cupin superfamily)